MSVRPYLLWSDVSEMRLGSRSLGSLRQPGTGFPGNLGTVQLSNMRSGLTIALFALLLSPGLWAQEQEPTPAYPYVPYRMSLPDYNLLIEGQEKTSLYKVQATPAEDSLVEAGASVELTLTFNRPVDPATLPPVSEGWSLDTPWGRFDSTNLAQGEVFYSALPQSLNGVAYPPSTLRFRLPLGDMEPQTPAQCRLFLESPPRAHLGQPSLDFAGSEVAYQAWSFRPLRSESPQGGGAQYLVWERGECSALLTSQLRAEVRPLDEQNSELIVRMGRAPWLVPYQERILRLTLPNGIWKTEEAVSLPQEGISVRLTELLYQDLEPPQGKQQEPTETFQWEAETGSLQFKEWTSEGPLVGIDVQFRNRDGEIGMLKGFFTLPQR